jgi:hypothetical protein
MHAEPPVPGPDYQGTERTQPIPPCTFTPEDLARLYRTLQGKSNELFDGIARTFAAKPGLTIEQQRTNLRANLRIAVIAVGAGGEQVITHDESALLDVNLPENLKSILLDSAVRLNIVSGGQNPVNRFNLAFDFSRTPLFDLTDPSDAPTPNASHFQVVAADPTWAAGVLNDINTWVTGKRVGRRWLHLRNTYEILQLTLGMWLALWWSWRAYGAWIRGTELERSGVGIILAIYLFIVSLYVFRLMFAAVRWLWPYLEFQRPGKRIGKGFRVFLGTVIVGLVVAFVYDVIKTVF